jgi:hypothetical protein
MPRKSSGGDYPPNWNQIAEQVKTEAGWKCVRCQHIHEPGHILTVHHLDMNPSHCEWWNLVALCQQCHLSIQARVVMERTWLLDHSPWFVPYVAGYYAAQLGLSTDRSYVIDHAQEIIVRAQGRGK